MTRDTRPDAQEAQLRVHRRLGGEGRVQLAAQMSEEAREISRAGITSRHPEYGPEEIQSALLRMLVGDTLFRVAWPDRPLLAP